MDITTKIDYFNANQLIEMAQYLLKTDRSNDLQPLPEFDSEEAKTIIQYLFYKPSRIQLVVRQRRYIPKGFNIRQQKFIANYVANGGNGAKAAREAGYSKHSAKQIAYRLTHQ